VKRKSKEEEIFWVKVTSCCRVTPTPTASLPSSLMSQPAPMARDDAAFDSTDIRYLAYIGLRFPGWSEAAKPCVSWC